jgi:zinc transport system permease protein
MVFSSLLGILFTLVGLWFSYSYNLSSGATIIMAAGIAFFLSMAIDSIKARIKPMRER